jgi:hypothetical protein
MMLSTAGRIDLRGRLAPSALTVYAK